MPPSSHVSGPAVLRASGGPGKGKRATDSRGGPMDEAQATSRTAHREAAAADRLLLHEDRDAAAEPDASRVHKKVRAARWRMGLQSIALVCGLLALAVGAYMAFSYIFRPRMFPGVGQRVTVVFMACPAMLQAAVYGPDGSEMNLVGDGAARADQTVKYCDLPMPPSQRGKQTSWITDGGAPSGAPSGDGTAPACDPLSAALDGTVQACDTDADCDVVVPCDPTVPDGGTAYCTSQLYGGGPSTQGSQPSVQCRVGAGPSGADPSKAYCDFATAEADGAPAPPGKAQLTCQSTSWSTGKVCVLKASSDCEPRPCDLGGLNPNFKVLGGGSGSGSGSTSGNGNGINSCAVCDDKKLRAGSKECLAELLAAAGLPSGTTKLADSCTGCPSGQTCVLTDTDGSTLEGVCTGSADKTVVTRTHFLAEGYVTASKYNRGTKAMDLSVHWERVQCIYPYLSNVPDEPHPEYYHQGCLLWRDDCNDKAQKVLFGRGSCDPSDPSGGVDPTGLTQVAGSTFGTFGGSNGQPTSTAWGLRSNLSVQRDADNGNTLRVTAPGDAVIAGQMLSVQPRFRIPHSIDGAPRNVTRTTA